MVGKKIETVKEIVYGANKILPIGSNGVVSRVGTDGWIVTRMLHLFWR